MLFAVGAVHERVALPVVDVGGLEVVEVEELDVEEEAGLLVAVGLDAAVSEVPAAVPEPPQPERHSNTAAMPQAAFADFMNISSRQLILERRGGQAMENRQRHLDKLCKRCAVYIFSFIFS